MTATATQINWFNVRVTSGFQTTTTLLVEASTPAEARRKATDRSTQVLYVRRCTV